MTLVDTALQGAYLLKSQRIFDERGYFMQLWNKDVLSKHGLVAEFAYSAQAGNSISGTLRGLHYQSAPVEEIKLVHCSRGAIYDVLLDLRPRSSTFKTWIATELSEADSTVIYVPAGVAHGYQTLRNDTIVGYHITPKYAPDHAWGVRWNDPAFEIRWPSRVTNISARDASFPDFRGP